MNDIYDILWDYIDDLEIDILREMGSFSRSVEDLEELVNNPRICSDAFEEAKEILKKDLYNMNQAKTTKEQLKEKILYLYIEDLTTNVLERLKAVHKQTHTGKYFLAGSRND